MNSNSARNNSKRGKRVASRSKAVTHRELNGFALAPKPIIPSHNTRPTQQRTVRLTVTVPPAGDPPLAITPANIAAEDAAEYGVTGVRFNLLRVVSARVWGADSATAGTLNVSFFVQGATLPIHAAEDQATSGAQRANVGYVYPYASRGSPYATSATTTILSISTLLATTSTAQVDVTVLFD